GGPDSVRGFYPGSLGPKDQYGNPYGGNINVLGRAELILPLPAKVEASARLKLFFDIGNIFSTSRCVHSKAGNQVCGPTFYAPPSGFSQYGYSTYSEFGALGPATKYNFSLHNLKESVGVAVEWLAPMGLFRFSFAVPLNAQREIDGVTWGDDTERFQFDIGQAF
ncbi:MAG: BamA/TamA family outer membrane protein, partial [Steroidobacteraceae bacterium]